MEATQRIKEIEAILQIIETKSNEYSKALHAAEEENKKIMETVLPELSILQLRTARRDANFRDEIKSFELDFNGYSSFSISLTAEKAIKRYSASMISDSNPSPEEFTKTVNYYSDVAKLLHFADESRDLLVETFLSFNYPNYDDYKTGFNEYELKQEKYRLEKEIEIQKLDFKVDGIYQLLVEGKRRDRKIIVKVESISPKRFKYTEFYADTFNKWVESAALDYNKISALNEQQKALVEGK